MCTVLYKLMWFVRLCEPLSTVGCVTSDVLVFPVPEASVVEVPASVVLLPAWP